MARVYAERAVGVREALVKEYPESADYRDNLAESYLNRGPPKDCSVGAARL